MREERERLGLSQAKFAEACGVKRTAQTTYETGERSPSAEYLQAAGRIGVDVPYLLTGLRTSVDTIERRALIKLLDAICGRLGVDWAIDPLDLAYAEVESSLGVPREESPSLLKEVEYQLFDALSQIELNGELLAAVLSEIDDAIGCMAVELSPSVKADLAVVIYRASKQTKKVYPRVVNDAVRLAVRAGKSSANGG